MKVLIAVRNISYGGAEILECRLAVALNKRKIRSDLLSQYYMNDFDIESDKQRWQKEGVPEVYWLKARGIRGLVLSIFRLIKLIRVNKYDFVITSNSGLDTLVALAGFFCSFKHIVALHDYPHPTITKLLRFQIWKNLIARKAYKIYAISEYVKFENLNHISINPEKVFVIYNSIDVSFLEKASNKKAIIEFQMLPAGSRVVLFVGRLVERKGIDIALRVLSIVQRDFNAYLFIAGETSDRGLEEGVIGYEEILMKLINELSLENRVKILGKRKDIFDLMKQSDLIIHLPRHEGFGLVLLEAIAAGTPIVASNIGGIPEVLKKTPYKVFDPKNISGIADEVKSILLMDEFKKNQLTETAKTCLNFYSDERRSQEIIEKILF